MLYGDYRNLLGYSKRYNTKDGGALLNKNISNTSYGQLNKYDKEQYRRTVYLRNLANNYGLQIAKVKGKNIFSVIVPNGFSKVFDTIDAAEEFTKKYVLVQEYFLEE